MKYTQTTTEKIIKDYEAGVTPQAIALTLSLDGVVVPERSVIAKLSSLGVYKKKEYLTKRGEIPVKKSEYIEEIALLLGVNSEILESLEKVNKSVLALIALNLTKPPV